MLPDFPKDGESAKSCFAAAARLPFYCSVLAVQYKPRVCITAMSKKPTTKKASSRPRTVVRELGAIHAWMQNHEREDSKRFNSGARRMMVLATKEDLADLAKLFVETDEHGEIALGPDGRMVPKFATKKDVQPVVQFYDKLALSAQLVNGGSKWFSRIILGLAALLVAIGLIKGYFVSIFAALISTK